MAVSRNAKEVKLVIRVDEGNDKVKSLTYNRIKVDANDEAVLAAGKAIGVFSRNRYQEFGVMMLWR